jgi:hypothetical protein
MQLVPRHLEAVPGPILVTRRHSIDIRLVEPKVESWKLLGGETNRVDFLGARPQAKFDEQRGRVFGKTCPPGRMRECKKSPHLRRPG